MRKCEDEKMRGKKLYDSWFFNFSPYVCNL